MDQPGEAGIAPASEPNASGWPGQPAAERETTRSFGAPAPDQGYAGWLRAEYPRLIERLGGSDDQRIYLMDRWLAEYLWLDKTAGRYRVAYYVLRLVAIVGGVSLPALATFAQTDSTARVLVAVVSAAVAVSVALDGLFRPGERWRHYRRAAEELKTEGWRYLFRTDPYSRATGERSFELFASNVEKLLRSEVDEYVSKVIAPEGSTGSSADTAAPRQS
jgi:hypothetical protein